MRRRHHTANDFDKSSIKPEQEKSLCALYPNLLLPLLVTVRLSDLRDNLILVQSGTQFSIQSGNIYLSVAVDD